MNRRISGRSARLAATGFTRPAIYSPHLQLLFQVFPADQRLKSLVSAAYTACMAPVLETLLAERTRGAKVDGVAVRVIRYKPGRKCLLRHEIAWAPSGRTARCPPVAYGKVRSRKKLARTAATLKQLYAVAEGLLFDLPGPYGVVPKLSMELLSRVPGVRLCELAGDDDFPRLWRRVAAGIHQIHASPLELERERGVEAMLMACEGVLEKGLCHFGCAEDPKR